MKKRLLFSAQVVLFGLFSFSLIATIFQFFGDSNPLARFNYETPVYNNIEAFDPSLSRLNSLEKLEQYCDSIYAGKILLNNTGEFENTYVDIVSDVIRDRFYHGYSYGNFSGNYVGEMISRVTIPGLSALVAPDDIMKYPYAACSQQAIVMMEVLQDKGFMTRKIGFNGKISGHFAFEAFTDGAWHFHDPNLEPDKTVLNSYGRPGIDFLARNPEILVKAYNRLPRESVLDIFPNYSYGHVNKFPAPRALIFQQVTKFLSYSIWLFFLISFIFIRRRYLRVSRVSYAKNNVIPLHHMQPDISSIYYPDYTAQGNR